MSLKPVRCYWLLALLFVTPLTFADDATESVADNDGLSASEVFHRRILPILKSQNTSCTECHFGGVRLQDYIREDQATTFAALRDQGLIDVEHPNDSKILEFIRRHTDGSDELQRRVRDAELVAFETWINAAVSDPELLASETTDVTIGTELPEEVIRHMRRDHVLAAFVEDVWSQMGRCIGCHSPENNERLVRQHGDRVSWIHPGDPLATLQQCVEQGIIDTDNPESSYLLLKPLVEVEHQGGPKFVRGSQADQGFRRFLNDYAAIVNDRYQRVDDLPTASDLVVVSTRKHLRFEGVPEALHQKMMRVDIYRWESDAWSESPWGTADNPIAGMRQLWQSLAFATAPRDSRRADEYLHHREGQLPPGRYLFRIYIDQEGRVGEDRDYVLGEAEFYGEIEHDGDWPPGYQPPLILQFPVRD